MISLYSWGRGDHGQLGMGGGLESPALTTPQALRHWPWCSEKLESTARPAPLVQLESGDEHTAVLTANGRVFTCGSNDWAQLGHDQSQSRFERVEAFDTYRVTRLACGGRHNLALDEWGKVFAWGCDERGQLGTNTGQDRGTVPKMIRGLGFVVQVAAGGEHSLILTDSGQLLAFGDNSWGQLGLGKAAGERVLTPQPIDALAGVPIKTIACGAHHSVVVTLSGAVFAWGNNASGQCGVDGLERKPFPVQVRSLRGQNVCHVACGEEHTVCLTSDGGVFSFGWGRYGQLGHGSWNDELVPRKIIELMGTEVSQIACGKRHTLAFVPSRGRLYAFGLGGSGQLGRDTTQNCNTPQVVHGPWVSSNGNSATPSYRRSVSLVEQEQLVLTLVGAGGDQSFAACCPRFFAQESADVCVDHRLIPPPCRMKVISTDIEAFLRLARPNKELDQDLLEVLVNLFQSQSSLNGSLLLPTHQPCSSKNSGIDLLAWTRLFELVKNCQSDSLRDIVQDGIIHSIIPQLPQNPPDVESLRIFITLPLFHQFEDPRLFEQLQTPFASNLISLPQNPWNVIERWISEMDKSYFHLLVRRFKAVTTHILKEVTPSSPQFGQIKVSLILLRILNRINVTLDLIIDYEDFYIPEVSACLCLPTCYEQWLNSRNQNTSELQICDFPFVFDAEAKSTLLHHDQTLQMNNARTQAIMSSYFDPQFAGRDPFFLRLFVSRENIVIDTLNQIQHVSPEDFKKPLHVRFIGEVAEDEGGVKKEFFMFFMKGLLDPSYGMFKNYEETRTIWFYPFSFEDDIMFFTFGVFCGLAIYNFVIINLPFPLPLFKKLLGKSVGSVEDLATLSPTVAKSLRDLLQYEGDDIEDVFCLNFTASVECYGSLKTTPLKPHGADVPVNQSNRKEYVELYCDFMLNKSCDTKFAAFKRGFDLVCKGRVLELFQAHELMSLVVGNENYEWEELEKTTDYGSGYSPEHPTIKNFWSVFHNDLGEDDRRNFLLFLTGSDRIPNLGMKSLAVTIQKTGDVNYLPVAHTCFNLLDLPDYATRERLRYKLLTAIQHNQGFGLA